MIQSWTQMAKRMLRKVFPTAMKVCNNSPESTDTTFPKSFRCVTPVRLERAPEKEFGKERDKEFPEPALKLLGFEIHEWLTAFERVLRWNASRSNLLPYAALHGFTQFASIFCTVCCNNSAKPSHLLEDRWLCGNKVFNATIVFFAFASINMCWHRRRIVTKKAANIQQEAGWQSKHWNWLGVHKD